MRTCHIQEVQLQLYLTVSVHPGHYRQYPCTALSIGFSVLYSSVNEHIILFLIIAVLDGRRPLNIAVIGPPGCGKSSFLNTIFASFKNNDKACWKEIAKAGDYGEQDIQKTSRLRM
jgi:ABC-type transport system involved in cytochrome bd biosynthesis fused ATPase/permease subunit